MSKKCSHKGRTGCLHCMKVWNSVLCLQTAAGGAGRQAALWASTEICPNLSRKVGVYLMWQRPIWGRNTKRCVPGLPVKPAVSLSAPPHCSHFLMVSLSRLLIPPISLAFSYCLGRDLPARRKGCYLLNLRSTMRPILFKSTNIGQLCDVMWSMGHILSHWNWVQNFTWLQWAQSKGSAEMLSIFAKPSLHFIEEKQAKAIWIPEHPWYSWGTTTPCFFPYEMNTWSKIRKAMPEEL